MIATAIVMLLERKSNSVPARSPSPIATRPNTDENIEPGPSASTPSPDSEVVLLVPNALKDPAGLSQREAPAIAALRTLEKFLSAVTLDERMPLIETRTPPELLADSVLAGPLPPTIYISTDRQESNAIEQLVDVYYQVDFDKGDGKSDAQTILVRTRHGEPPKVVADPFLDLYGGRLLAYSKRQTDRGGVFQVIACAGAFCFEEHVPDRARKLTLRLMATDGPGEISRAYFSKFSKIGEMIKDETIQYGRALPCTVMLRWNLEDDPNKPYLEAIDIKSLNWNP